MSSPEGRRVDAYLHTIGQIEPEIHPVDRDAALTSIAISLKRIADAVAPSGGVIKVAGPVAPEHLAEIRHDFLMAYGPGPSLGQQLAAWLRRVRP